MKEIFVETKKDINSEKIIENINKKIDEFYNFDFIINGDENEDEF